MCKLHDIRDMVLSLAPGIPWLLVPRGQWVGGVLVKVGHLTFLVEEESI